MFYEQEWGVSQTFSYYGTPRSKDFSVSLSVLNTSLQREKKRKKNIGSLQQDKKRKRGEEKTNQISTKKQKLGITSSTDVDNVIRNTSELVSSSPNNKKKKLNNLVEKNSVGDEKQTKSFANSVKKNKKNKRNKYKELNINQQKMKIKPDDTEKGSQQFSTCLLSVSVGKQIRAVENIGKLKTKKKKRLIEVQPESIAVPALNPPLGHCNKLEISEIPKKFNNKGLEDSIERKVSVAKKTRNKGSKKKKQGKEGVQSNSTEVEERIRIDEKNKSKKVKAAKRKKIINVDSNDMQDEALKMDIEAYFKEKRFEKFKNGTLDIKNLSDDEEEIRGIDDFDDSENEYIEDNFSKSQSNCKAKAAKTKKKNLNKNNSSVEVSENKSNDISSHKKEGELCQFSSSSKLTKGNKFDKHILSQMLQDSEEQHKRSSKSSYVDYETSPKESALSAANELKQKMTNQLNAARFRLVNEQMYTTTSSEAAKIFKSDKAAFESYHVGFQSQVARWPMNPLDVIIKWLKNKPKYWVVADFGCGEAKLAASAPQTTVHSLDLVALNSRVEVCDMSHTHLQTKSVDVVVFCLSLMGTNIKDFIIEANRVLKEGGTLRIAEVESRFNDVNVFTNLVKKFGFHCVFSDTTTKYFFMFEFKKHKSLKSLSNVPDIILKPCKYKKR